MGKTEKERTLEQIGFRVPAHVNSRLDAKAKEIGISKNALLLVLVDIGLKTYDNPNLLKSE